jgi:hypothetical protein
MSGRRQGADHAHDGLTKLRAMYRGEGDNGGRKIKGESDS